MDYSLLEVAPGERPLDRINPTCGLAGIFRTIGVIGASLCSGEFEATGEDGKTTYHDMYEYSWPAVLQRLTGTEYRNFSRGGLTAKEFYTSWADKNGFWQPCQAYIISLGNNDLYGQHQKPGRAIDVHPEHPELNPDTYIGWIARIISRLKVIQPRCRVFVISVQIDHDSPEKDEETHYVAGELRKLCSMFEYTYLIDQTQDFPAYDRKIRRKYAMGFHPNPIGYYFFALAYGNYIDYIIRSHPEDFADIGFIGTDLKR